jgi:hypothetical protein
MSLTLEVEQILFKVSLQQFFEDYKDKWKKLAQRSYSFVKNNFPDKATIRIDDVAKALLPLLQVDEDLINILNEKRLKQKFWFRDFGDLILDRTWAKIQKS